VSGRTAIWLCGTALILGLLGDQLLRPEPGGAGTALWLVLSTGTALVVAWRIRQIGVGTIAAFLGVAAGFAACLAWRDAGALKGWNLLAIMTALTMAMLELRSVRLWAAGFVEYATEVIAAGLRVVVGPVLLLGSDRRDDAAAAPGRSRHLRALTVGVVLTIPLVLLFGALLASADPVFERLTRFFVDWDLGRLLSHLLLIGFLSWISAGYLRGVAVPRTERSEPLVQVPAPTWGALEIGIPLGALALLFLTFIVIQARYLFGGEDLIRTTVGLTYAEYARRGFFELVAVAGLVLPVLLAADWAVQQGDRVATRVCRGLAAAVLVLVALIIVSAAIRLRLYREAYGLTEDRFHAAVIMAWIACALAWFGATVLRGQRGRFVAGAILAGFAVVAVVNVIDPDAMIARANLARAARGDELDAGYLTLLDADAAPVLAAALPTLTTADRCTIVRHLTEAYRKRQESDWRTWSLGRSRADAAFRVLDPALRECPAPEPAAADSVGAGPQEVPDHPPDADE